jgi:hypothetical protein
MVLIEISEKKDTYGDRQHEPYIPLDWILSKKACPDTCVICWEETTPNNVYICNLCKNCIAGVGLALF